MNARSSSRLSSDIDREVEAAVRAGRKQRHALRQRNAMKLEFESVMRAVHALFEYGALRRMQVTFKRCSAECRGDGDESTVSDGEENGDDDQYYALCVEMRCVDEHSNNGVPLSGITLAAACRKEVCTALASTKDAKSSVTLDNLVAAYEQERDIYTVRVELAPPEVVAPPPKRVAPPQPAAKKRRVIEEQQHAQLAMPSENDCVEFYGRKPNTWSLFGFDLSRIFSPMAGGGGAASSLRQQRRYR